MAISLKEFHSSTYELHSAAELRLLYQLYEEAQRGRVAHGERLRAILQARLRALRVSSSERTTAP